jgi:hypothetical protein
MQYMMLIYLSSSDFEDRASDVEGPFWGAWRAYFKALADAGAFVGGSPLEAVTTATTVRLKNGKRLVQDGPYADTKEQLGGFVILELPSLDAALDWASRCPAAATGAVEIRPMHPMHEELADILPRR